MRLKAVLWWACGAVNLLDQTWKMLTLLLFNIIVNTAVRLGNVLHYFCSSGSLCKPFKVKKGNTALSRRVTQSPGSSKGNELVSKARTLLWWGQSGLSTQLSLEKDTPVTSGNNNHTKGRWGLRSSCVSTQRQATSFLFELSLYTE